MHQDPTLKLPDENAVRERAAAYEAEQVKHAERVERIVQAFTKLPTDDGRDLSDAIRAALTEDGFGAFPEGTANLSINELEAISRRIAELNQMVMQGSMVLDEDAIRREAAAMARAEAEAREATAQQPQRPQEPAEALPPAARARLKAAREAARKTEDRL